MVKFMTFIKEKLKGNIGILQSISFPGGNGDKIFSGRFVHSVLKEPPRPT